LIETGIAIFDTAYQIKRLKGNAADKFLEIVTPTDLAVLLQQIPLCQTIMTTGDKATDTLISVLPEHTEKPLIGMSTRHFLLDEILIYIVYHLLLEHIH
jgi:G:T/U-mismatch repair DNA glycosylase